MKKRNPRIDTRTSSLVTLDKNELRLVTGGRGSDAYFIKVDRDTTTY